MCMGCETWLHHVHRSQSLEEPAEHTLTISEVGSVEYTFPRDDHEAAVQVDALSRYAVPLFLLDCNKMHTSALVPSVVWAGSDTESGNKKTLSQWQ